MNKVLIKLFLSLATITISHDLMAMENNRNIANPEESFDANQSKNYVISEVVEGRRGNALSFLSGLDDEEFKHLTDLLNADERFFLDSKLSDEQRQLLRNRMDNVAQLPLRNNNSRPENDDDFINSNSGVGPLKKTRSSKTFTIFGIGLISIIPIAYLIYKLIAKPKNNKIVQKNI